MKKTIPTSIANALFYIEEDASQILEKYMEEVREYFRSFKDTTEIIKDIESRIAEQLLGNDSVSKHDRIVTIKEVESIIASIGRPKDFDLPEGEERIPNNEYEQKNRKLYRDTENGIIAGVASGIASYFGVDPMIVRAIFFISIFFGGAGFVIYLFLWVVTPEAKSASEKLEMRGDAVTLESVGELFKKKINELSKEKSVKKNNLSKFFQRLGNVGKFSSTVLGKIIGLSLQIVSGFAIFGIVLAFTLILMEPALGIFSLPIFETIGLPIFYLITILTFLVIVIPWLFISSLGKVLSSKKPLFRKTTSGILVGLFALSLIILSVTGVSMVSKYSSIFSQTNFGERYMETETLSKTLEPFEKLVIKNGQKIEVIEGEQYGVLIEGTRDTINNTSILVSNNTLTIKNDEKYFRRCFFCSRNKDLIVVTVKSLSEISVENASSVRYDEINTESLNITLKNASSVSLGGKLTNLDATIENASRLMTENLKTDFVELSLENASLAHINTNNEFNASLENGSRVVNHGTGKISDEEALEHGSRVEYK